MNVLKKSDAGHINSCLGSSKSRLEGLVLLHQLIRQCETDAFTQHAITWCKLLVKILQSHAGEETMGLTCTVFGLLLRETSAFPEISREVSASIFSQLVTAVLSMKNKASAGALSCLCCCMQYYPGGCGAHQNKIEAFAVGLLEDRDEVVQKLASRCFALAVQCGGGGSLGVKHTEAWSAQMAKVMGSLHNVLSHLYVDCETDQPSAKQTGSLSLNPVLDTEPERTISLVAKVKVTLRCATDLLREGFPAMVKVPLEEILSTVCRILAVTPKMLGSFASIEKKCLAGLLPEVHVKTFQFLEVVISSCGGQMIPFCGVINQLFTQTLQWTRTRNHGYGKEKPYSVLRQQVYRTMEVWLRELGATSNLDTVVSPWLQDIRADIITVDDTLKLDSTKDKKSSDLSGPPRKKKKKGGLFAEAGQLASHRKLDQQANAEPCAAGLKVFQLMFAKCGCLFSPKIHKELYEVLIPQVLRLQQASGRPPIPYTAATCRRELYQLLVAMAMSPHPSWPPPLACIVGIMRAGQSDADAVVSSTCAQSMLSLENLLHPRVPSLACPLPRWQPGKEGNQAGSQGQGHVDTGNQSMFGIYGESFVLQQQGGNRSVQNGVGNQLNEMDIGDERNESGNVGNQSVDREEQIPEISVTTNGGREAAESSSSTGFSVNEPNVISDPLPKIVQEEAVSKTNTDAGADQEESRMETSDEEETGGDEQGTSPAAPSTSGISAEVQAAGTGDKDNPDEKDGAATASSAGMQDAEKDDKNSKAQEDEHTKELEDMMADFVDAGPDSDSE